MSHPLCFSIHEIREWLAAGPPYPLDPSRDLVYPSAGYVDSGNIKTTRDPVSYTHLDVYKRQGLEYADRFVPLGGKL